MAKNESDFMRAIFGQGRVAPKTDATAVAMPDPDILRLKAKIDSLKVAHHQAMQDVIQSAKDAGMPASALYFLGQAVDGDPDARTAFRTEAQIPAVTDSLAAASKRRSKFSK